MNLIKIFFILMCTTLFNTNKSINKPFHIGYSIPESKIVTAIPQKTRDFAVARPHFPYCYEYESDYYQGYQTAYYGITQKKGGWDCLRHYEILANGCIPYFLDIDQCDNDTLYFLPKNLIKEAMNLDGVSLLHIDHSKFNHVRYYQILAELLDHTRKYLTTKNMARYILETLHYTGSGKILVLSQDTRPEYLRDTVLTGLKELLGARIIDIPKIPYLYFSYDEDVRSLYGKGMTYTKNLPDLEINRDTIKERIKNREFDLIIYAETHKGKLPYHKLVKKYYSEDEIAYFYCTETESEYLDSLPRFGTYKNLFLREYCFYNRAVGLSTP